MPVMPVTPEQVQDIVGSNDGNQNAHIASLSVIKSTSYSYTASWTSYHIALSDSGRSYLLLVSPLTPSCPQPGAATPPGLITLPALSDLLSKILDNTVVPVPRPVAHDVSGGEGKWQFGWLLLRVPGSLPHTHPPVSLASVRHQLSPGQLARVELRLGTYLCALHGITNDWFGIPMDRPTPEPPSIPSFATLLAASQTGEDGEGDGEDMTPYSWQDTFVLQLEELLEHVCGDAEARRTAPSGYRVDVDIDVDDLRRSLTRAIGSFLFDDVEMPRLIWVTGNEEDVIVSVTREKGSDGAASEEDTEADIAYILPTFGRALWGDPLMETWFLPPGPTTAIKEGYFGSEEDGTLIVFPRHQTKRMWYTVYLALMVLAEEMPQGEGGETTQASGRETIRWARSILPKCVEILKNAPCY
ncbi:hypothetical protein J3R82DRAFT_1755 [Butyriboletus roseoflavus]|nr:hypothetical protein J3R82DRAFT_1755 [Butyriboletus roseoflavus]